MDVKSKSNNRQSLINPAEDWIETTESAMSEARLWISVIIATYRDTKDLTREIDFLNESLAGEPILIIYRTGIESIINSLNSNHFKWMCEVSDIDYRKCVNQIYSIIENSSFFSSTFKNHTCKEWRSVLLRLKGRKTKRKKPSVDRNFGNNYKFMGRSQKPKDKV